MHECFISCQEIEAAPRATALRDALVARGLTTFVCCSDVPPGAPDWWVGV